ncbi:MAG: hypothetical protein U0835_02515 [Isosphaeraceae bacterium]
MRRTEPPPEKCPDCGGSHLVRILWDYGELSGKDVEDVTAGFACLGLNYRYFRLLEPAEPSPAQLLERALLPGWACLDCHPRWLDFQRLVQKQMELDTAKWAACRAEKFELAAALFHRQREVEQEQGAELLVLLRELAGVAVISEP